MKNSLILLVVALGFGVGGCTTTTYNGMQYRDGSYYAPADGSNGDYYVAPEPDPYFYDPYYGPYGYPGYWWQPLSYGWGGDGCGLYRFCPLWATRWYDPWYDPWYVDGYGYGGGYGYGSGYGFSLTFGDGGWYGGGSGWYGGSWGGGGWHGGGRHGRGGHDGHDGRGGNRPPRHRDGPAGPTPPSAPDSVAVTDPPIDAGDEAGESLSGEDAIGGAHGRPLPGRRWWRVAPGAPIPQAGVPSRWFERSAPSDGQRVEGRAPRSGGWGNAGSPRSGGGRSSGSGRSGGEAARTERHSEPAARADDDGGGRSGRRVRGDADDT